MSIYPVPLQKWFPHPRKAKRTDWENYWHSLCEYEAAKTTVELNRCDNCGKHCKYNRAWGHHSIPWGYGEVWCSEQCLDGPKKKKKKARQKKVRGKRNKELWASIFSTTMEEWKPSTSFEGTKPLTMEDILRATNALKDQS